MVTIPMVDALRAMRDQLDRSGVRLQLAELPAGTLDALRRLQWFAGVEAAGVISPTVDDALLTVTRGTPGPTPEQGIALRPHPFTGSRVASRR